MSYDKQRPDDHTFVFVPHQTGCERCGYARGHHPTAVMLKRQQSASEPFATAALFPDFAEGWIVIDARDAPRLANAVGSRIYRKARNAQAFLDRVKTARNDGAYLHAVPVDGPNSVFALDFIGADGVTVNDRGEIRIARRS